MKTKQELGAKRRLSIFVSELLAEKNWSKEELGRILSVTGTAVQGWSGTNGEMCSTVDPMGIKVGTFFELASLRGWSGDQLYEFLLDAQQPRQSGVPGEEIVTLLTQALTLVKRGNLMRNWNDFLQDLRSSLTTTTHSARFAAAAGLSDSELSDLLEGRLVIERAEQIYTALLQCGFPVLDSCGDRWSERDGMVAYAEEQIRRSGHLPGRKGSC